MVWRWIQKVLPLVIAGGIYVSLGCGGGGGSSSSGPPPIIESVQATIPASGGTLTGPDTGTSLDIANGALAGPTAVKLDIYKNLAPGDANASVAVTNGVGIELDPSSLAPGASLNLSMPVTQGADDTVYGVIQSGGQCTVCPATMDHVHQRVTLNLSSDNIVSLSRSRSPGPSSSSWLVAAKQPVKPSGSPSARVDLYQLMQVVRYGDPDASPSVYKQDFNKDWKSIPTPAFGPGRVAIVVHGILNDLSNLTELAAYLKDLKRSDGSPYYQAVYGLNTEWRAGIADNGALFGKLLAAGGNSETVIDVFAHSQGGLVSRDAIEQELPNHATHPTISRLFTFGTPHLGVPLPGLQLLAELGLFRYWPGVVDLGDTSTFIQNLNGQPSLTKTDYITLAGDDFADAYGNGGTLVHQVLGVDCDGIVPVYSAQGALIAGHAHTLSTLPVFHLTHPQMRGLRQPAPLDLDVVGAQRLRDYILGTNVTVGIN